MTTESSIRPATNADADAIGRLTVEVYLDGGFATDAYVARLRDGASRVRDAVVLVAEVDGALAGSVTIALPGTPYAEISAPNELEVRMLAVARHTRRRGIADRLMDEVEAHARATGLEAVVLSTEPEMHAAHRLYERRGYERQPERDWQVDDTLTLLVYRRTLPR